MPLIDLGSGVKYEATTVGSGTGNYNSFLRIQHNGDEDGYNTDVNNQLDNKDGIWTHSLLISSLAVINVGGTDYYEIRLDLDEVQSGDGPPISLDDLEIFYGAAAGAGAFPSFAGLTKVFDLSGSLALTDTNHGSGTDDYHFLIPTSLFPDPSQYFTLYAAFSGADDGFEEFRAKTSEFTPQPDIGINKQTNLTDDACPNILTGEDVTWTYTVTNNGNLPLSNVVVTDDNGTPLDTSDDFHPDPVLSGGFNIGDVNHNNILDLTETWQYSETLAGGAVAGEYANIAYVTGAWSFGGNSGSVNANEDDCYFGADPKLEIVKLTDGIDNLCPVLAVGEDVTWTYNVTNSGNIAYADGDFTVTDDGGDGFGNGNDFNPNQVVDGLGHNTGDTNGNDVLDPGETWHYTYTGTVVAGHYENVGRVAADDFVDDFGNTRPVGDTETDCYTGVEGCVRTPGFWQNMNNGGQFWDQTPNNEKHAGEDHFPTGELLYKVDSDGDGDVDGNDSNTFGLLIGDYNKNGFADNLGLDKLPGTADDVQEDVLYISYADARALINASNKQLNGDGKFMLGRDMVASWLNYLSGAGIGDASDTNSPHHYLDDAINWMQKFSGLNNVTNGTDLWDQFKLAGIVKTNVAIWNTPQSGIDHSASQLHSGLDGYNNTGTINGFAYASDCDNPQLLENLNGFSVYHQVYLV